MPQGYVNQHHSTSSVLYMQHQGIAGASPCMVSTNQGMYPAHAPQVYEDLYSKPAGVNATEDRFGVPGWNSKKSAASSHAVGHHFHVIGSGVANNQEAAEGFLGARKGHTPYSSHQHISGGEIALRKEQSRGGDSQALRAARLEQQSTYTGFNVITGKDHPNCPTAPIYTPRQNGAQAQEAAIAQKELRLEAQRARIGELRKNRISNDGLVYSNRRGGSVKDSMSWSGSN